MPENSYSHLTVISDIWRRRMEQDKRWGGANHDDKHSVGEWMFFIEKQISQHERHQSGNAFLDAMYARDRLIDIAALAFAAVQAIDRKTGNEKM